MRGNKLYYQQRSSLNIWCVNTWYVHWTLIQYKLQTRKPRGNSHSHVLMLTERFSRFIPSNQRKLERFEEPWNVVIWSWSNRIKQLWKKQPHDLQGSPHILCYEESYLLIRHIVFPLLSRFFLTAEKKKTRKSVVQMTQSFFQRG